MIALKNIISSAKNRYNLGYPSGSTSNCRFYSDTETTTTLFYVYKLNDSVPAKEWGTSFLSNTNSACTNPNSDNLAALNKIWDSLKTSYNSLSTSAQNAFKNNTSGDATITSALARYTHIVNRYSTLNDFIGLRNTKNSSSNVINNSVDNNVAIAIVTLIAFVGASSIGGYVILRKKRQ